MFRLLLTVLLFSVIYASASIANVLDSCYLNINAPSLKNKVLKIGYFYGSKIFLKDTILLDDKGVLNNKYHLNNGIYLLILPDSSIFEFMIDENDNFFINVDDSNNTYVFSIKGNPVTEAYDAYFKKLYILNAALDSLHSCEKKAFDDSNKLEILTGISTLNAEILNLRKIYSAMYTGSLLSGYLKAIIPFNIRELDVNNNNSIDTTQLLSKLKLYQKHYLDNIDLNDERLLYTPILAEKLNFYLDVIISQKPDNVISEIERVFNLSENQEVKKFIIESRFEKYNSQKNNAVPEYLYASLIENFYLKGKTPWCSNEQIQLLTKELNRLKPNLLSQVAPEIKLPNEINDSISLYSLNGNYTLLLFWETECSFCIKIIQDLNKIISRYDYLSIKVFSIGLDPDFEAWKTYTSKYMPKTWYNTIAQKNNNITHKYNISHTPAIFLLDRNKKIINKYFTIRELDNYLLEIATNPQVVK